MPAENQDPNNPDASPAPGRGLRSREEQMPGWTSTLGEINQLYRSGKVSEAQSRMKNLLGDLLTNDLTVDTNTGQIRDMTWWERNGDVTLFLAQAAAAMVAGIYLSGANASTPGVGNAPQTAPAPATTAGGAGAPGAGSATGAGAGAGASGAGAGEGAADAAGLLEGANAAGATGAGVGLGESGAVAGLPAGSAGLPGSVAAPAMSDIGAAIPAASNAVYLNDVGEPTDNGLLGTGISKGDITRSLIGAAINYALYKQTTDAQDRAAQAQTDAINRAIDLQSRIYDTTRADVNQARGGYKPYQQLGQSVLPTLYKMVGLTPPSGAAGIAPTGLTNAGARGQGLNGPISVPGRRFGTEPVGPGTSLTGVGSTDHSYQTGGLTVGAPAQSNGAMVTVQGPDGSTRRVPYEQAAFYQSRGGTIIG